MKHITYYFEQFQHDNAIKNLSPESIKFYNNTLKKLISYLDSQRISKPNKITDDTIKQYTMFLLQSNISEQSVNSYLRGAKRFLSYLCSQKIIKHVEVKLIRTSEPIKPVFTASELKLICSASHKGEVFIIAMLLLGTAIRASTLTNIQVQDLDMDDGYLTLRKTKNRRLAELPLTSPLAQLIRQHIKGKRGTEFLFTNTKGGKFTRHCLWDTLERFYKELGIEKKGIHIFRRTFGKEFIRNGGDAFTLQTWFTHSSITQSKKYVDLYGADLRKTMDKYNPTANLQINIT